MLVSAVSANHFQSNKISQNEIKVKSEPTENNAELSFNSLAPNKKVASIERLSLYNSINEWKDFCHKQICSGNLDIIA